MKQESKNAIIISTAEDTAELCQLAHTLGYDVGKIFIQKRDTPDTNYYIGSGKVQEVHDFIEHADHPIDLIIVNGELKPSQWFSLEKKFKKEVYDRIRLILAIFEKHANRREAKLQVKLAQLEYERPYVRELIHRAKAGEHPGYMGGGEYPVADYYEMIKKQMKNIRNELEKIRTTRQLHRQTRYTSGFYLVSLAGYTNAGKSSLLNVLAQEHVFVEDQLFSTLSTTTRKIPQNMKYKNIPLLLTDTVGFIENLPAVIIDAFHSTLEEIQLADAVILVVDSSEPKRSVERKLNVSLQELHDLGVTAPIILAFNKIDLITETELNDLIKHLEEQHYLTQKKYVAISVQQQQGLTTLLDVLYSVLPHDVLLTLELPNTSETHSFISELYTKTFVTDIRYSKTVVITVRCSMKIQDKIIADCNKLNGKIQEHNYEPTSKRYSKQ
ncbi:MAG: GTPase HflX [Candidatus Thermoplasmatota archaeon]